MRVAAGDLNRHARQISEYQLPLRGAESSQTSVAMRPHGASRRCEKKRSASVYVQNPPPCTDRTPAAARARARGHRGRPASGRAALRSNRRSALGLRGDERVAHLGADLVRRGADRGPEPRDELARAARRTPPPPPAARRSAARASRHARRRRGRPARSQSSDRQAIRRQHGADDAGAAVTAPSAGATRLAIEVEHSRAVHLLEPTRLARAKRAHCAARRAVRRDGARRRRRRACARFNEP